MLQDNSSHSQSIEGLVLDIVAQEAGVAREGLSEDTVLSDLGIDGILSASIAKRVRAVTHLDVLPESVASQRDLKSLITYLVKLDGCLHKDTRTLTATRTAARRVCHSPPSKPIGFSVPLSIRLQGNPTTASEKIFLLPDGSGAATSYAQIPPISPNICLYAINSPFLREPDQFSSIEDATLTWVAEIRKLQPQGPYILGGWSAGGYYAFEVAKKMLLDGEEVQKLVLIDSPCRLAYEALPMDVVRYLAMKGILGSAGEKTPQWLLDHFDATIMAVEDYAPTAILPVSGRFSALPEVFLVWASDPVFPPGGAAAAGIGLNRKITKFMLEERQDFGTHGWENLFPGARFAVAKVPGTHFSLVLPPNLLMIQISV
ncbi:Alpha/Beta hydrolase protein [Macrophomina phaseolina]|uniref:Alpha/Beta hydrolase protein n=1 Tax=Macrophomina phaseolina TaxID=35725 RepID=A0ABQ8FUK0_9PEZI|nr:Alpha/Beta hydrolase protein [Macrophomina phaseolina]